MTNTNQQEQLYRWRRSTDKLPEKYKVVACKVLYEDIDPRQDWELHWLYIDKFNKWQHIKEYKVIEWLEPYTPPVEDGKQGGEVGMSVEDVLADIILIRNKLHEDLPTGEMNAFELLQTIKWHINELDNYCTTLSIYKSQPSTPVQPGERINKVKDAIGFLLSCAYPEMIASEYNRNKEVLTEICKLIDTIATSTPVQDGWVKIEDGCKLPVIPPPYKEDGCTITPMEVPILCHQDDSICLDWYNDSGIEWFQLKEYTHWQPLPSPPVNKQD